MKKLSFTFLIFCIFLTACTNDKRIGIIGGADGPTAIFVTSNINWLQVCGWVGVMVAAVVVALMIYRNKKE